MPLKCIAQSVLNTSNTNGLYNLSGEYLFGDFASE